MSDTPHVSSTASANPHCSNATNIRVRITDVIQVPSNDLHENVEVTSTECFDDITIHAQTANGVIYNMSCEKFCMSKGRNKKKFHACALEWLRMVRNLKWM